MIVVVAGVAVGVAVAAVQVVGVVGQYAAEEGYAVAADVVLGDDVTAVVACGAAGVGVAGEEVLAADDTVSAVAGVLTRLWKSCLVLEEMPADDDTVSAAPGVPMWLWMGARATLLWWKMMHQYGR